jgi:CHASE1-domain containing sensor protein
LNEPGDLADNARMRLRFWVGLAAVLLIAAGSVVAALVVAADDSADFHASQREEAVRAAHQAESVAGLSIGQLSSAAAFFQAESHFSRHEFDVIAEPLLSARALSGAAFIQRVPASGRADFERLHGAPIFEGRPGGPRPARPRPVYFPIVYAVSSYGSAAPTGYDLGADPERVPFLRRARDRGKPVATPPVELLLGGAGINVYWPVYRDGAQTATVAERRCSASPPAPSASATSPRRRSPRSRRRSTSNSGSIAST